MNWGRVRDGTGLGVGVGGLVGLGLAVAGGTLVWASAPPASAMPTATAASLSMATRALGRDAIAHAAIVPMSKRSARYARDRFKSKMT